MPATRRKLPLAGGGPDFAASLRKRGLELARARVSTLQVNVGKLCNQACHHCHVEAGPKRTEIMRAAVADRILEVLAGNPAVTTLDLTGGAPELNPSFRRLVRTARSLGRHVIDRCNLTVLYEPGMADLAGFLAEHQVEVVASLPCYGPDNVDAQRGRGVFARSVQALRELNHLGYGRPGSELRLNLVYNPLGASLPPAQDSLEARYRDELYQRYRIEFHQLYTITNVPIRRFAHQLERSGRWQEYMSLLVNHLNPATVPGLMCRSLVSISHDGRLYDCDFNQMADLDLGAGAASIFDVDDLDPLIGAPIATASHCFACTAGAGSSCGGALQ